MYSIKPGRGPSAMGVLGGVVAVLFGIFWTAMAATMGAPGFFVLFGILFVVMALAGLVYHFHNATQKNRMSSFDITTGAEESDPIADALGHTREARDRRTSEPEGGKKPRRFEGEFCPFCGAKAEADFDYCPKCGKDI